MKKNSRLITFISLLSFAMAGYGQNNTPSVTSVPPDIAQKVAVNFYTQNLPKHIQNSTLAFTEKDDKGNPVYYIFNINNDDGFVIVTANTALEPIIGYSNAGHYIIPAANTNADYWMQLRKTEIISDLKEYVAASPEIADKWNSYISNKTPKTIKHRPRLGNSPFPSLTYYLVQSHWDQSPAPYWSDCPDSCSIPNDTCLTGCVATAMAQVMRYWQYPLNGIGSSSYTPLGCFGPLSTNYSHTYNWANMPLTPALKTKNPDIAQLISDAGISVAMNYGTKFSGSTAILTPPSAQFSLPAYFGYSSTLIDGIQYGVGNFTTDPIWIDTLEHELNCNRPFMYGGGVFPDTHEWVCDGYDQFNNFHMNWGWSGNFDGWFNINTLTPNGHNFTANQDALIGIMPPSTTIYFYYTGNIQNWTIPSCVTQVTITAEGAAGGDCGIPPIGGRGASLTGICTVVPGDILSIVVGGQGKSSLVSGGGGGSFVWDSNSNNLLIVGAGGGGGTDYTNDVRGGDGGIDILTNTTTSGDSGSAAGGVGGNGGTGGVTRIDNYNPVDTNAGGGGGAGWSSYGGSTIGFSENINTGGNDRAFVFKGGNSYLGFGTGGYGGGGGAGVTFDGATGGGGGGGGYNGGGGGNGGGDSVRGEQGGGGGGSFLNGTLLGRVLANDTLNETLFVSISYTCITGLTELQKIINTLNIYPNPNNGNFMVAGATQGQVVELYNFLGQKLSSLPAENTTIHFDISDKPNGIYLIRVLNKDGSLAGQNKIIKTR